MATNSQKAAIEFAKSVSDGKKQPYLENWPPQTDVAPSTEASYGVPAGELLTFNTQGGGAGRVRTKIFEVDAKETSDTPKST